MSLVNHPGKERATILMTLVMTTAVDEMGVDGKHLGVGMVNQAEEVGIQGDLPVDLPVEEMDLPEYQFWVEIQGRVELSFA